MEIPHVLRVARLEEKRVPPSGDGLIDERPTFDKSLGFTNSFSFTFSTSNYNFHSHTST